jgi:lipoprotein NlpD
MLGPRDQRALLPVSGRVWRLALLWLSLVFGGLLLAGCNTTPAGGVRVVDRNDAASGSRQPASSGQHVVQRGDTLYSIAFRFGWDWKVLAQRNNIVAPYVIKTGQVIRFDGRSTKTPVVVQTNRSGAGATGGRSQPVVARANNSAASVRQPVAPPVTTSPAKNFDGRWTWPAKGSVITLFSSNGSLNKGIDIAGELGEPVLAASDGSVVYAGSGLRGYGELVIIKHSDTYVSAYGHNRRLLVREGQQVKVGQVIAEMGSTGTDRVKLHFEIRRQGKPVDPQQYLPKR